MKEKKKLLQKHELYTKGKIYIMNLWHEENADTMDSESKRRSFSMQKVGRKTFP